MVTLSDTYNVVSATIPLYFAMIIAYASVKWWKLFTPDQCSGISKFVSKFSIPFLSFQVISESNPFEMNPKLILSDLLQKALVILILVIVTVCSGKGERLNWIITGVSLSTLPNTLIIGIPILKAMYGDEAVSFVSQIVVLQSLLWYNLLLFLFEFGAAEKAASSVAAVEGNGGEDEESRTVKKKGKAMHILLTVCKRLITNPNTYAAVLGLIWACIHFKWGVKMPEVVKNSIMIMANGGLGMAMFSLGVFIASQNSLVACGKRMAMVALAMKFIVGPALMALSSFAVGLRGNLLKVAIAQAALPQGIVPFVFAKEYDVHPKILSTGIIFGMVVALPVALAYYYLLEL